MVRKDRKDEGSTWTSRRARGKWQKRKLQSVHLILFKDFKQKNAIGRFSSISWLGFINSMLFVTLVIVPVLDNLLSVRSTN